MITFRYWDRREWRYPICIPKQSQSADGCVTVGIIRQWIHPKSNTVGIITYFKRTGLCTMKELQWYVDRNLSDYQLKDTKQWIRGDEKWVKAEPGYAVIVSPDAMYSAEIGTSASLSVGKHPVQLFGHQFAIAFLGFEEEVSVGVPVGTDLSQQIGASDFYLIHPWPVSTG
jgi:hypothetical protein